MSRFNAGISLTDEAQSDIRLCCGGWRRRLDFLVVYLPQHGNRSYAAHAGDDYLKRRRRHRHRHSLSVDGGSSTLESIEAKKAMARDKLAELWVVDPKRAKRFRL